LSKISSGWVRKYQPKKDDNQFYYDSKIEQTTDNGNMNDSYSKPLTPQEQEYVKAHEDEYTDRISRKIARDFKGVISLVWVTLVCSKVNPDWVRSYEKTSTKDSQDSTNVNKLTFDVLIFLAYVLSYPLWHGSLYSLVSQN
jgi:hypothetical protein